MSFTKPPRSSLSYLQLSLVGPLELRLKALVCLDSGADTQSSGLVVQKGSEQTRNILGALGVKKLCLTNVLQGERVKIILYHPDPGRQQILPVSATIDHDADFDLLLSDWHHDEFESLFCEARSCKMMPVRASIDPDPNEQQKLEKIKADEAKAVADRRKEDNLKYIEKTQKKLKESRK